MRYRAYETALNLKYDWCQRGLASMVYSDFDEKTVSAAIVTNKAGASINEDLAQKLLKPVIKKFKRKEDYARFKDNIWSAHLAEMGSLTPKNWCIKCLLCLIVVCTKYTYLWKIKNLKQFLMVFLK